MKRSRISAGLLMFRKKQGRLEVLLAHPGGPYFQNKDGGIWTVPKGEVGEGEDLLARAKIEFEEELGVCMGLRGRFKGGLQISIQYLRNGMAAPFR